MMLRLHALRRAISVLQAVEHAPTSNHLAVTFQNGIVSHAIPFNRRGLFGIGGSSEPDKEAVRNAEKMLDLMASSPKMQQLMMAAMPPAARNPETIQMLLKDPGMRQKFVQMLAKQGMKIPTDVLERMTAGHMEQTFDRATRMGLNPEDLFKKLMSHPELLAKLQQPRIMSVFMELSTNPENAYKYQSDKETMEVIQEIRKVLGQQSAGAAPSSSSVPQPQPQVVDSSTSDASAQAEVPTAADVQAKLSAAELEVKAAQDIAIEAKQAAEADMSEAIAMAKAKVFAASEIRAEAEGKLMAARAEASRVAQAESAPAPPMQPPAPSPPSPAPAPPPPGSPASSAFGASPEAVPNVPGGNLTAMMMADPKLAEKLQNPKVRKALEEIGKSPWKTIKYIFDKEVMEVFGALNNMMRGKDPWHDKKKKP